MSSGAYGDDEPDREEIGHTEPQPVIRAGSGCLAVPLAQRRQVPAVAQGVDQPGLFVQPLEARRAGCDGHQLTLLGDRAHLNRLCLAVAPYLQLHLRAWVGRDG